MPDADNQIQELVQEVQKWKTEAEKYEALWKRECEAYRYLAIKHNEWDS